MRQQGELLLGDVTRAAGFLRQFVVYGHQQIGNLASVNLARALRDMAPILRRVLGDDIMLLLPRIMGRFDVDVDAERVERILVNVANYARHRMPHGGRVKIRLATRWSTASSSPVTRKCVQARMCWSRSRKFKVPSGRRCRFSCIGRAPHPEVARSTLDKPGMDLGPLVALIGDPGGHLWMSAEPAGNMTLQIHLPKRTQDESWSGYAASRVAGGSWPSGSATEPPT